MRKDDTHDITQYAVGRRSKEAFRFDLIDKGYQERITNNLEYGALKYNDGKEVPILNENWLTAVNSKDVKFILDTVNHLKDHVLNLLEIIPRLLDAVQKEKSSGEDFKFMDLLIEDDIAHASFNLMILSKFMDNLSYDANYWRPIYQKRVQEIKDAKAKFEGNSTQDEDNTSIPRKGTDDPRNRSSNWTKI
jgi:hypothetical protein